MAEMKLTVSEIKELMDKMNASRLTEMSLKSEDFELCLKAEQPQVIYEAAASGAAVQAVMPVAPAPAAEPANEEPSGNVVKSPLVGTFYASSAPDKPAFAPVGTAVHKGDTLFIVESMKLMNEIKSEFDGTVTKVLVENGEGVEYGQPILTIE